MRELKSSAIGHSAVLGSCTLERAGLVIAAASASASAFVDVACPGCQRRVLPARTRICAGLPRTTTLSLHAPSAPRNSSTSAAYVRRNPSAIGTPARQPSSRSAREASRQLCCSSPAVDRRAAARSRRRRRCSRIPDGAHVGLDAGGDVVGAAVPQAASRARRRPRRRRSRASARRGRRASALATYRWWLKIATTPASPWGSGAAVDVSETADGVGDLAESDQVFT